MSHTTHSKEKGGIFVSNSGTKTISEVDAALRAWVMAAAPGVEVTFSPPSLQEPSAPLRVNAWLYQVKPLPVIHPAQGASEWRVTLSYLLTLVGTADARSHDVLHALLMAAVNTPRLSGGPPWSLASELPGDSFWLALGAPPQPCVILTTQLKLPKNPLPGAPPVKEIVTRWETSSPSQEP